MPYYSRIILNSFYNRLFPKLFQHNRRMPIPDLKYKVNNRYTLIFKVLILCSYMHVCVCVCARVCVANMHM